MKRAYNFSAGPAILPESVLQQVQAELLNYHDTGLSVMEMSHRSPAFSEIIQATEQSLRNLLQIPDNYHVLFLQGGATLQFSMVPLNLNQGGKIGFVQTGSWSKKAMKEAQQLGFDCVEVASSEGDKFRTIPEIDESLIKDLDYLHITSNNTIYGSQFKQFPNNSSVPLVADMSSDFLSRPFDINQFGLVYAGAQKNLGPAGVTVVIIREDLVKEVPRPLPVYLNYQTHIDKNSLYNTPPTFAIYVMGLVLKWIQDFGGLAAMDLHNQAQAQKLYDYLDQSQLFKNVIEKESRSMMNVTFSTGDDELDGKFLKQTEVLNMVNLKGHRSVGGLRASIYNAFPDQGIDALVQAMSEFEEDEHVPN